MVTKKQFILDSMADKKKLKSIEVIVNDDVHKKRLVFLSYEAIRYSSKLMFKMNSYKRDYFRLVHKDVGADQCNNMLSKLEEDAEVAYLEYDKAVKAEDRAQNYVIKVI